jgi:hypothetical protein
MAIVIFAWVKNLVLRREEINLGVERVAVCLERLKFVLIIL